MTTDVFTRPMTWTAIAVLAVATACGSSDEASPADPSNETVAESGATDAADAEADGTANEDQVDEASTAGDFCERLLEFDDSQFSDDAEAASQALGELIDDAPDSIREDLELVVDAFSQLADLDPDDPESFEMFLEVFGSDEVIAASENLTQFGIEECGLDANGNPVDDDGEASSGDEASD
jgi:hypothetical protein